MFREPRPRREPHAPAGQRFFWILGRKISKSLKKSRAVRAQKTPETDLAENEPKREDPAKMTYSIPDFLSRNEVNVPIYFQCLESRSPIINKNV